MQSEMNRREFIKALGFGAAALTMPVLKCANIFAAESSVRDVDFAEEAANFSKMQILTQAGSFSMAQANKSAQLVLSLLQG